MKIYLVIFALFSFSKIYAQNILGNDTLVCKGQYYTLKAGNNGPVLWSTGERTDSIRVYQGGKYWVEQGGVRDEIDISIYHEEFNQASFWSLNGRNNIKFDTARPAHISHLITSTNNIPKPAGNSSAVDNDGNLLFSTNGESIIDTNGNIIETGFYGDINSAQNSIISPLPGSAVEYYLFTIKDNSLYYSVIKINPDKSITTVSKNTLLETGIDSKISIVRHANKDDLWVMVHQQNSNIFKALPFTKGGIGVPVISKSGTPTYTSDGYMKFSPDGKRLALAADFTEVFNFNNSDGTVSSYKHLYLSSSYGLEFSIDANFLYVTTHDKTQTDSAGIVTEGGSLIKVNIGWLYKPEVIYRGEPGTKFGALQIGPDNRIYVAQGNNSSGCLGVINRPTDYDIPSGYEKDALCFNGDLGYGLPNFPQHYFTKTKNLDFYVNYPCAGDSVTATVFSRLSDIPYAKFSFLVDYGTIGGPERYSNLNKSSHFFPGSDTSYLITVLTSNVCEIKPITRTTYLTPQPVVNFEDTVLCPGEPLPSYMVDSFPPRINTRYYWLKGEDTVSTTRHFIPQEPGKYQVKMIVANICDTIDDFEISYRELPDLNLGDKINVCEGDSITLSADIGLPEPNYLWSTQSTNSKITVKSTGDYKVEVNDNSCKLSDSVTVTFFPKPENPRLKEDTIGCFGKLVEFNAQNPSGFSYLWNTGESTQTISAGVPGEYVVEIYNEGCKLKFGSNLKFHPTQEFNLEKEYIICEADKMILKLDAGDGKNWLWNPGNEDTREKSITTAGEYTVTKTSISTGCVQDFKVNVKSICEPKIYAPNAFTPNNDLINEFFYATVINIISYEILIYNRWGELVFTSQDPSKGWDGKYNNEDSPADNYVYIINYTGESLSGIKEYVKKGSFLLMR